MNPPWSEFNERFEMIKNSTPCLPRLKGRGGRGRSRARQGLKNSWMNSGQVDMMKHVKGMDGVFIMRDSLVTVSLTPGVRVYGEAH